jgi:hypothetical protein
MKEVKTYFLSKVVTPIAFGMILAVYSRVRWVTPHIGMISWVDG